MGAYAAGATVERRYPGPSQESARQAAEPQVEAFVAAGWKIAGERWVDDAAAGTPIGDAIATGAVSYLAGSGGSLVITYVAAADADLPALLPAYAGSDPRRENLRTFAGVQIGVVIVFFVIFAVIFVIVASTILGQVGRMGVPGLAPVYLGTMPPAP